MADTVRIGVVGAGAMGQGHLKVWQGIEGAKIAAVCDPIVDRARDVAGQFAAKPFADLAEMLDSGEVDAVDIATPSGLHADQAQIAAERGIHTIVEKPLDLNIEKVDRLIATCERTGAILGCV